MCGDHPGWQLEGAGWLGVMVVDGFSQWRFRNGRADGSLGQDQFSIACHAQAVLFAVVLDA